jgi:hypothetical protein
MEIRNVDGIFNQRVTRVLASVGGDPSLVDGRKKRAIDAQRVYYDAIHRDVVGNRRGILAVLHAAHVRASKLRLTKRKQKRVAILIGLGRARLSRKLVFSYSGNFPHRERGSGARAALVSCIWGRADVLLPPGALKSHCFAGRASLFRSVAPLSSRRRCPPGASR